MSVDCGGGYVEIAEFSLSLSLSLSIEFRCPQRSERISNCAVNLRYLAAAATKCLRNCRFDEFLLKGEVEEEHRVVEICV